MTGYLWLRTLHIVIAALWVGSATLLTAFVGPTLRRTPNGGEIMGGMMQRHFGLFMAAIGMITVLSGLWLYWSFTEGFSRSLVLSGPGIVFGIGGIAGVIAALVGGGIIGRHSARTVALARQMAQMPDGPDREAQAATISALTKRVAVASKVDAVMLLLALVLMSLGHAA